MLRTMHSARTKIDDDLMTGPRRRQFSPAFKVNLVEQCATASVTGVALERGISPVGPDRLTPDPQRLGCRDTKGYTPWICA
jgi:hypothetical protein